MPGTPELGAKLIDAFRQGLRELGYVEGQNIRIDFRWQPVERPDLLPEIVSELVRSKPEVLVGPTTPQALALKQATTTIPIVMVVPSDPVGTGLVASLSQPGGNVTGLAWMSNDIIRKRLELLKETFPKTLRVSDLWNPSNPATRRDFKEVAAAAAMMGMTLHSVEVRDPSELPGAFSSIASARTEALIVQTDQLTYVHRREIASLALQKRLPTMFFAREHVDEGGLMSYGANLADMYRRSAVYVDKILKGAKPSELPVQQPTKFEFVVNLKTAKTLGVTIPGSILFRADDVIR
jgi:putative ABC transport system substrate-binding protein